MLVVSLGTHACPVAVCNAMSARSLHCFTYMLRPMDSLAGAGGSAQQQLGFQQQSLPRALDPNTKQPTHVADPAVCSRA